VSDDPIFTPRIEPEASLAVRILDLSGGNGAEPVETIRGFATVEHVNAFARRYVRDSVERCRTRGLAPADVLAAWFAFGEDAEVVGAGEHAWRSAAELDAFTRAPPGDAEERNWRVLDPRRLDEDSDDDDADSEDDEA
jgi:hypothetical protein